MSLTLDIDQSQPFFSETPIGKYRAERAYSGPKDGDTVVWRIYAINANSDKGLFVGYVRLNPESRRWSIKCELTEKWYLVEYSAMNLAVETLQFVLTMQYLGVECVADLARYSHQIPDKTGTCQSVRMVCACRVRFNHEGRPLREH